MPKFSERGFSPIALILFLLIAGGLVLGIMLVRQQTNFLPKAYQSEDITSSDSNQSTRIRTYRDLRRELDKIQSNQGSYIVAYQVKKDISEELFSFTDIITDKTKETPSIAKFTANRERAGMVTIEWYLPDTDVFRRLLWNYPLDEKNGNNLERFPFVSSSFVKEGEVSLLSRGGEAFVVGNEGQYLCSSLKEERRSLDIGLAPDNLCSVDKIVLETVPKGREAVITLSVKEKENDNFITRDILRTGQFIMGD